MAKTADDDGLVINGKLYTPEDLTFREQREVRKLVRELAENPEADLENMAVIDTIPAFVCVVLRRDQPDLKIDDVLDMRLTDFIGEPNGNGNGNGTPTPPTKKASGTSGRRKSPRSTA